MFKWDDNDIKASSSTPYSYISYNYPFDRCSKTNKKNIINKIDNILGKLIFRTGDEYIVDYCNDIMELCSLFDETNSKSIIKNILKTSECMINYMKNINHSTTSDKEYYNLFITRFIKYIICLKN